MATQQIPTPSDTYNPRDQGTAWPPDSFTQRVTDHVSPQPIVMPASNSYDGDGNMEAIDAFPPFSQQENRADLGAYTGAVGPAGGSTPESQPASDAR